MNYDPTELTHAQHVENRLASFMEDIEDWQSEIEGSPTPVNLKKLDEIYEDFVKQFDSLYGYNQKACTMDTHA